METKQGFGNELEAKEATDAQIEMIFRLASGFNLDIASRKQFSKEQIKGTYFEKERWDAVDIEYTPSKGLIRGKKWLPCISVSVERYETDPDSSKKSFISRVYNIYDNHEKSLDARDYIVWVSDQYLEDVNNLDSDYAINDNYNERFTEQIADDILKMVDDN